MASGIMKFQVKSSNQYLNIPSGDNINGSLAAQDPNPNEDKFLWQVSPDPAAPGWYKIQVQSSKQFLNILNAGMNNGDRACQGITDTTDNFRWQFEESQDNPGYYLIKVKHSLQYLNIAGSGNRPGTEACQGNTPTSDNFLWTVPARAVNINMQVDCAHMYEQPAGEVSDTAADDYIEFSDDNRGGVENPGQQKSFKSDVFNGSKVVWDPKIKPGTSPQFSITIDDIIYEAGSDDNIFSSTDIQRQNGKVTAFVLPTAPVLADNADNESYTIKFTITPTNGTPKQYWVDPKLKINGTNTN